MAVCLQGTYTEYEMYTIAAKAPETRSAIHDDQYSVGGASEW